MKSLLTTILILITLQGFNQSLMLTCRRSTVTAEMKHYPDYHLTVCAKDYREYQKDSTAIAFHFIKENSFLGAWRCSEAIITMPLSHELEFMEEKSGCNCWQPIEPDVWLYQTNVFQSLVKVTRYYHPETVTFVYGFR